MNALDAALLRLRLRAEDWARTRSLSRWPALARLIAAHWSDQLILSDAIARYLVSSHPNIFQKQLATKALSACRKHFESNPADSDVVVIARSIVAKSRISPSERGVLIVSFESELEKLAQLRNLPLIEQEYQIMFLPTWQPSYSNALFLFAARAHRPYYLMPASPDDLKLHEIVGDLCRPLPFQASSWVNSRLIKHQEEKNIDILVLANFSKYKRHWKLFEGLKDVNPSARIVLAGRPWGGRTADTLRSEAVAFGVEKRIEIIANASDAEIATLLAQARLFCAMSHKEGSYIAVAEALIAGTPVAIFSNSIVGSKSFIGPQTGFLLDPGKPLGSQLNEALRQASALDPAAWARKEISADASAVKLNSCMRKISREHNESWSTDIVPFYCRNFAFFYSNRADELLLEKDYRRLAELGLTIEGFTTNKP